MSGNAVRMRVSRIKKKIMQHIDLFLGLVLVVMMAHGGVKL